MPIIPYDAPVLLPISKFYFRLREYGFGNRITHGAWVMGSIAVLYNVITPENLVFPDFRVGFSSRDIPHVLTRRGAGAGRYRAW